MWIIQRTTTKTDQVSIKPKYIQLTTKNETLTHILSHPACGQFKANNKNRSIKYQTK